MMLKLIFQKTVFKNFANNSKTPKMTKNQRKRGEQCQNKNVFAKTVNILSRYPEKTGTA